MLGIFLKNARSVSTIFEIIKIFRCYENLEIFLKNPPSDLESVLSEAADFSFHSALARS